MEQEHSEACIWCSAPEDAQTNFRNYISIPAPDWASTADEDISDCMDCVKIYHRGRAAVVAEKPDIEQVFFHLEVKRLQLSLNECVVDVVTEHDDILDSVNEEDVLYNYWGNSELEACPLPVPVQEILWFPFYLQDEDVNEVFCCVMKVLYKAEQLHVNAVDKPLCGLFMLLIHPNNLISNWARKSVARLGSCVIRCEEFTQVISLMLSVKSLVLFENRTLSSFCEEVPSSRPILSSHLFPYLELDYWQGLSCFLRWISEENLNHLGSELHSEIICIYSTTLMENNFKTVDECNSFWDKLVGFQQLINKLGFRIWQYLKEAPDVVFNSIFNHPCVRNAVNKMKDTKLEHQLGNRLPETSPYAWIRPFVSSLLEYDSIAKHCVTMVLNKMTNEMDDALTNQMKTTSNQPIVNDEPSLYIQHSISSLVEILESLITCNFLCVSLACFEKCFKMMTLFLMKFQQNLGSSQQFESCHTSLLRFIRKLLNICVKKEISLAESQLLIRNVNLVCRKDTDFTDVDSNLLKVCVQNLVEHLHSIRIEETVRVYNDEGASTSTTSEEHNKNYCTHTFEPFVPIKEEIQDSDSPEPSQDFMEEDSSLAKNFVKVEDMICSDSEDNLPLDPRFVKKEIIPSDCVSDDELLLRHGLTRKVSVQVKKLTVDDIEQIRRALYTMQGTLSCTAPGPVQDTPAGSVQCSSQDTLPYTEEETAPGSVEETASGSVQCSSQDTLPYTEEETAPGSVEETAPGSVEETASGSVQCSSQDTLPYTVEDNTPDPVKCSAQDTVHNAVPNNIPSAPAISHGSSKDTVEDAVPHTALDTMEDTAPDTVKDTAPDTGQRAVPYNTSGNVQDTAPDTGQGAVLYNTSGNVQDTAPDTGQGAVLYNTSGNVQDTAPDTGQCAVLYNASGNVQDTAPDTGQGAVLYNTSGNVQDTAPDTGQGAVLYNTSGNVQDTALDTGQGAVLYNTSGNVQDTAPDTGQGAVLYNTSGNVQDTAPDTGQGAVPYNTSGNVQDTAPDTGQGAVPYNTSGNVQDTAPDTGQGAVLYNTSGNVQDTAPDTGQGAVLYNTSGNVQDTAPDTGQGAVLYNASGIVQDTAPDNLPYIGQYTAPNTVPDSVQIAESLTVQDIVPCTVQDRGPLPVPDNALHITVDTTVDKSSDTSSDDVPETVKDTAPDVLMHQYNPYKYTDYRIQEIKKTNSEKLIQAQKKIKLQKDKLVKICRQDDFPISSDSKGPEAMLCTDTAPDALQDTALNTVMDVASATSSDNVPRTAQDNASDVSFHHEIHYQYTFSLDRLRGLIKISKGKTTNQNQIVREQQDTEAKERTQDSRLIEGRTVDSLPYTGTVKQALPYTTPVSAKNTAPDPVQTTALDTGTSSKDVPRAAKDNTPHISSHKPPIKCSLDRLRDSLASGKKTMNLQQYLKERQTKRANERQNRMLTKDQTAVTPDTAKDTPSTSFAATEIQSPETKIASQHHRFSSSADKQVPSEELTSSSLTTTVTQKTKSSSATAVQCSPEGVDQIPSSVNIDLLVAIVLSWKIEWLEKQVYPEQIGDKPKMGLMKVPLTFDSINSYINVFVPLLLCEIWHYVLQEYWKIKRTENNFVNMVYMRHYKISGVMAGCFLICKQKIFSKDLQQTCPCKLDLVILTLIIPGKEAPSYQVFAMVTKAVLQPIQTKGQASQQIFMLEIELQVLELDESILMACTQEDNNVQIQVVTSMMSHLRLFKCFKDLQKHLLAADILCPRVRPVTEIIDSPHPSLLEMKLDKCQSEAADKIFTCMETELMIPSISLLHGPPGTGKTRTIINIIERILKKERQVGNSPLKPGQTRNNMDTRPRILVCAPSNTAVDLLVLNVAKMCLADQSHNDDSRFNCGLYNIVRLGNNMHKKCLRYQLTANVDKQMQQASKNGKSVDAEKMRKEISDCQRALQRAELRCGKKKFSPKASQMELKQAEEERDHLHKQLKDLKKKEDETNVSVGSKSRHESILQHADVVFCTLNGSGFNLLDLLYTKRQPHFKYVIVDEACQCTEVDTLIPLQFKGLKLLLVGDPHQLQATVVSQKAKELGFQQSLFERMYKYLKTLNLPMNPVHLLRTQYRMHPEICSFPSQHFYNNQLETYLPIKRIYESFPFQPYLVFDIVEDGGQSVDKDITNEAECEMVLALVSPLVTIDKLSIGIITPYKQQNILLEDKIKRLGENIGENVEVSTVDSFQGQGKDVIILSCVRARGSSIGFVADRNSMNVALTRARKALYIVGHFKTLQINEDWKELMRDAEKRKLVHSVHIGQYEIAAKLCRKISQ